MTNHPRYSPPPQPGHRPGGHEQHAAPGYPGAHRPGPYQQTQQQPYDWRYATQQQFRPPYDPYRGAPQPSGMPMQPAPQKRSRAGALTAGAVAVAIVSAGIGGGVALLAQPDRPSASSNVTGLAPSVPAASL